MLFNVLPLFVAASFLISCQTSELVDPATAIASPKPTLQMARVSGKSFFSLKRGYAVYQENCAKCHEHRLPNTTVLPTWHAKISAMAAKAALNPADEKALQLYLDEFTDR